MPYTLSHPAAVLLLGRAGLDRRTGAAALPLAAAVAGTLAPDLPYYLPMSAERIPTHSVVGLFTVDIVMGFALYSLWVGVLLQPALWLAPAGVQRRVPLARRVGLRERMASPRQVALIVLAIWLGAFSHLLWDSFTHSGMWATRRWPVLSQVVSGHTIYTWLQSATSILGLGLLALALAMWWVRTPPISPVAKGQGALRGLAAAVIVLAPIYAAWPLIAMTIRWWGSPWWQDWLISALLRYTTALTVVLMGVAVTWHVARWVVNYTRTSHWPPGQTARSTPEPAIMRRQPSQGS